MENKIITPKITLGESVKSKVRSSVYGSVESSIWESMISPVSNSLWSSVYGSVCTQINNLTTWEIRL